MKRELKSRVYQDSDLMEGAVRLSLEECDTLQGLQVLNDCDAFGGFVSSFLTTFKDDYGKASTLAFAMLSGIEPAKETDWSDSKAIKKGLADALYLRAMHDLASLTIPVQSPSRWCSSAWAGVQVPKDRRLHPYYSSAILASHVETATLPLRLGKDTLASYSAKLRWQSANPFGELLGSLPLSSVSVERLDLDLASFTIPEHDFRLEGGKEKTNGLPSRFSREQVTRGFSAGELKLYDACYSRLSSSQRLESCHTTAYPLPSSFPASLLWSPTVIQPASIPGSWPSVKGVSALSCSSSSGNDSNESDNEDVRNADSNPGGLKGLFKRYALFTEECVRRKSDAALGVGLDLDELREAVQDLWSLVDNYD